MNVKAILAAKKLGGDIFSIDPDGDARRRRRNF